MIHGIEEIDKRGVVDKKSKFRFKHSARFFSIKDLMFDHIDAIFMNFLMFKQKQPK